MVSSFVVNVVRTVGFVECVVDVLVVCASGLVLIVDDVGGDAF